MGTLQLLVFHFDVGKKHRRGQVEKKHEDGRSFYTKSLKTHANSSYSLLSFALLLKKMFNC